MPSVKLPNGQIIECDAGHFEKVIKRQHPKAELVVSNSTKEVEAEAPIPAEKPKATRKKATRKRVATKTKVTTNGD